MLDLVEFKPVSASISIARAALVEEAEALAAELNALPEEQWGDSGHGYSGIERLGGREHLISLLGVKLFRPEFSFPAYPSLGRIASNPLFSDKTHAIINRQQPGGQQTLHPDGRLIPTTYVVHVGDGGAYDYEPGPNYLLESINNIGTGDVVANSSTVRHLGRNPSDHIRYTVVLLTPDKDVR